MSRLQKSIKSPRLWMTLSALSFVLFIGVGYHHDQMEALDVLASKAPEQVLIQDFVDSKHANVLQEVRMLAVVDIDGAVQVNIDEGGVARLVDAVPVYPVGREAKPFADGYLARAAGERRRPMPRASAAEVNTQHAFLELIEPFPVGMLIFDAAENDPMKLSLAEFATMTIASGTHGELFAFAGVQMDRADVFDSAQAALGLKLVPGAIAVLPFAENRVAPLFAEDHTAIRRALLLISALTMVVGVVIWFAPFPSKHKAPQTDVGKKVQASSRFPSVSFFQPIRTQSDLTKDDDSIPTPGRRISRVVSAAISPFRAKSRP